MGPPEHKHVVRLQCSRLSIVEHHAIDVLENNRRPNATQAVCRLDICFHLGSLFAMCVYISEKRKLNFVKIFEAESPKLIAFIAFIFTGNVE